MTKDNGDNGKLVIYGGSAFDKKDLAAQGGETQIIEVESWMTPDKKPALANSPIIAAIFNALQEQGTNFGAYQPEFEKLASAFNQNVSDLAKKAEQAAKLGKVASGRDVVFLIDDSNSTTIQKRELSGESAYDIAKQAAVAMLNKLSGAGSTYAFSDGNHLEKIDLLANPAREARARGPMDLEDVLTKIEQGTVQKNDFITASKPLHVVLLSDGDCANIAKDVVAIEKFLKGRPNVTFDAVIIGASQPSYDKDYYPMVTTVSQAMSDRKPNVAIVSNADTAESVITDMLNRQFQETPKFGAPKYTNPYARKL